MLRIPPAPSRRTSAPDTYSRSLFRWYARDFSDVAITGQVGAFVRAATGTAVDSGGATYTAAHSMPRWESRTGGGVTRLGRRLVTDDAAWPVRWFPRSTTIVVDMSEAGTRTTSGAGLLYLGNDAQTGARWFIDSDGTDYRATVHNGTTSVSVSLASALPTTGQLARLTMQVDDTGVTWRVRLLRDDSETTAWSSTIARAATFGTDAKVRLNRIGSAGTQGSTWVAAVAIVAGLRTGADVMDDL